MLSRFFCRKELYRESRLIPIEAPSFFDYNRENTKLST